MKATYACARGVQGEGKLDQMNKQGRIRGDLMLMAVDPDRVRFDVHSQFGVALASLTSDGDRFSFFDLGNKAFLEGPPDPCNIVRLTQVRVPVHVLVRLLRGEAPVLVHEPNAATIEWDGGGFYVVEIPGAYESREIIHMRPTQADWNAPFAQQRLQVLYVTVTQREYVHFEASMDDHADASTLPPRIDDLGLDPAIPPSGPACHAEVPRRIHLEVPYTGDDVRFRYQKSSGSSAKVEVGLNPPLPEGVFTQSVPGGVTRRWVTCR